MPTAAWFVDGGYLFKVWRGLLRQDALDYARLRDLLERQYCNKQAGECIDEAYYFSADPEPPSAKQNAFHTALQYPPPKGPGLRVKLYWLQRKHLYWPEAMGGEQVVHPRTGQPFELTQQKAVDVGLAFHLVRSQAKRGWRKLFLAAGDGDFYEPVQHLVEHEDVNLVLVGAQKSISPELLSYARAVVSIEEMAEQISRARPSRP